MAANYGRWRVINTLGQGGQGQVFRVEDTQGEFPGEFALKRLLNLGRVARFKREVETLARLGLPGVLSVVDSRIDGSPAYFVSPLAQRGSLEAANAHLLPLASRLQIFDTICRTLAKVHSSDIVHRDLKPANVLLDDDEQPIIADFGICFVEDGQAQTLTGEVMGPRQYTAPELEGMSDERVRPAADVYSLGKLLYWLLTGTHLPRERHRSREYDLAAKMGEARYELMSRLLDRTVCEDPDHRLPDAQHVVASFKEARAKFWRAINVPGRSAPQRCVYCGLGDYEPVGQVELDGSTPIIDAHQLFGLGNFSDIRVRCMRCPECGNIQCFGISSRVAKLKSNPWVQ